MILAVSGAVIFTVSGHEKLCNTCEPSGLVMMLSPEVVPMYVPVMLSILAVVDTNIVAEVFVLFWQEQYTSASDTITDSGTLIFMDFVWRQR